MIQGFTDHGIMLGIAPGGIFRCADNQVNVQTAIHPVKNFKGLTQWATLKRQNDEHIVVRVGERLTISA